jgi:predicted methyltransferase
VAATLSDPDRDERQKPRELVQAMGLQKGMTVADVGTAIGYMLPFLSRAVGPSNVTLIKGTEKDPLLPAGAVDQALVLDAYHHFDFPEMMLAAIHKALKPGGKLVIVEYYKTEAAMPNGRALTHIRLNKPEVVKEIEANHFRLVSEREQIKDVQYMLVLEKN